MSFDWAALENAAWDRCRHGDLPRWREAVEHLPAARPLAELDRPAPRLGHPVADPDYLQEHLMQLHPWRKGPLEVGSVVVDAEWRSDWKWDRVAPHVDLAGKRVLDVGCGNGYFGWRMLGAGASEVIGIDPTVLFVMQFRACRHFAGDLRHRVLPLALEDLPADVPAFDTVFSMGVLYHRRDPAAHLARLHALTRPGGTLVLETLVLDRGDDFVLHPPGRYARMRNVHAIPAVPILEHWLREAGFGRVATVDIGVTTIAEQRPTPWMTFQSLADALDPADPGRTVEGHPGPVRAVVVAHRAGRP